MSENPDAIRDAVREHYAAHATASSSCCSDSCCTNDLYDPAQLSAMPDDVSGFTLGCGDPVTLASLRPGETVLDLGSGGGLDCFLAAKQVGPTGRVIGVDMTPEMLARARAAAERLGFANVEFREGFIESLPVKDNSVDVVLSNCVINLSPDKPRVFREIWRVLKPSGRVSVSDIVTRGTMPESLRKNMDAWSACVSGALPAEEYAAGLREAGFVDVAVTPKGTQDPVLSLVPAGQPFSALITGRKP